MSIGTVRNVEERALSESSDFASPLQNSTVIIRLMLLTSGPGPTALLLRGASGTKCTNEQPCGQTNSLCHNVMA